MNRIYCLVFGLMMLGTLDAYAQRPTIDPKLTEVWKPVPPVITPGKETSQAPSDAFILFNGNDLSQWVAEKGGNPEWTVDNGAMTVKPKTGGIKTKQTFADVQLHIEWRTPEVVKGDGQGRGNSGIFFMERYELQVLDSYENTTYPNGQAASIYKQHIPLVNASRKPGEWQTYDVIFMAPVFTEKGDLKSPARITVLHNGVLVQNNIEIRGATEFNRIPIYEPHGKGSISLQDHGDLVSFRNIWIREL
ncbi:MAG: DUF1080 domain-containing protein [Cyclobacteriaceae bacterium]